MARWVSLGGEVPMASRQRQRVAAVAVVAAAVAILAALLGPGLLGGTGGDSQRASRARLDTYDSGDVAFFRHFQIGTGASEGYWYKTVAAAAKAADVVIVAEVTGMRKTESLTEEGGHVFYMDGLDLRPVEVLHGTLPDQNKDKLTVDFAVGSVDPSREIAEMNTALPEGQSVWFLHSKSNSYEIEKKDMAKQGKKMSEKQAQMFIDHSKYHRVVSSQGLYVQGSDHVVDPMAAEGIPGAVPEARSYSRMSQFVEYVRSLN